MWLRMENFNIIGVHEKIQFLGGGGGLTKNLGEQFPDLRGGLAKMREGGDFEGGRYPNANYAKI